MTKEEVLNVARSYKDWLLHETPLEFQHLVGMVPKMEEMEDVEKLMRWFGFMQGVLWVSEEFTLEQLKGHNKRGTGQLFTVRTTS